MFHKKAYLILFKMVNFFNNRKKKVETLKSIRRKNCIKKIGRETLGKKSREAKEPSSSEAKEPSSSLLGHTIIFIYFWLTLIYFYQFGQ